MRFEVFDGGDRDLLFVLGRGNDPEDDNLAWFIDRLTDADFRVDAAVLPTNVPDFCSFADTVVDVSAIG